MTVPRSQETVYSVIRTVSPNHSLRLGAYSAMSSLVFLNLGNQNICQDSVFRFDAPTEINFLEFPRHMSVVTNS